MASVKRTFSLPDEVSVELDECVPSKERSRFIAVTLRDALQDRKRKALLDLLDDMEPQSTGLSAQSEDVLRNLRDERASDILNNSRP